MFPFRVRTHWEAGFRAGWGIATLSYLGVALMGVGFALAAGLVK
jgi:hypothetical protein